MIIRACTSVCITEGVYRGMQIMLLFPKKICFPPPIMLCSYALSHALLCSILCLIFPQKIMIIIISQTAAELPAISQQQ